MTTNNAGWSRGWFYLRNYSGTLPAFTNRVLRERPPKWDWGVSPPAQQDKLEVLTDALAHLARKGLTAAAIIANFHRQRVIPLVERALPIFKLTPGSQAEGSRTSFKLLSHTTEVCSGGVPPESRGSLENQDAPRGRVHFSGEFRFRIC